MTPSTPPAPPGLFIVFEGLDGAGKTTQIRLLAHRLQRLGYEVVCLKEPTDGPWGRKIRQLTRHDRQHLTSEDELEWFIADRREDVEHNIRPALARGHIVLLDRYYFSTMAYQGALGFDAEAIRQRHEAFAPQPDILFLLDIPPAEGLRRVQQARHPDGFEQLDYLERVAALFAQMQFPYLRRIPANLPPHAVHARVWQEVQGVLAQRHGSGLAPSANS